MSWTSTTHVIYGASAKPGSGAEAKIMEIINKSIESGGDMFKGIGVGLYAIVAVNELTGKTCAAIGSGTEPFYSAEGLCRGPVPLHGDAATWRAGIEDLGFDPAEFTPHGVYILQDTA